MAGERILVGNTIGDADFHDFQIEAASRSQNDFPGFGMDGTRYDDFLPFGCTAGERRASASAVEPSYMLALATFMPVNSQI